MCQTCVLNNSLELPTWDKLLERQIISERVYRYTSPRKQWKLTMSIFQVFNSDPPGMNLLPPFINGPHLSISEFRSRGRSFNVMINSPEFKPSCFWILSSKRLSHRLLACDLALHLCHRCSSFSAPHCSVETSFGCLWNLFCGPSIPQFDYILLQVSPLQALIQLYEFHCSCFLLLFLCGFVAWNLRCFVIPCWIFLSLFFPAPWIYVNFQT